METLWPKAEHIYYVTLYRKRLLASMQWRTEGMTPGKHTGFLTLNFPWERKLQKLPSCDKTQFERSPFPPKPAANMIGKKNMFCFVLFLMSSSLREH